MKKIGITLVVVLAGLLVIAAGGAGVPWQTSLSGAAEVGGGDPDGSGTANLWLNYGQGTLCWDVSWANIEEPSAGHVHVAPAGVAGPVVIPLTDPDTGLLVASGCREVDRELLKAIIHDPDAYYVNLHNATYPGGAIRGQLTNPGSVEP